MRTEELGRIEPGGPLDAVWALLFPSRCLGCRQRGTLLCERCSQSVPWLSAQVCPRCAARSPTGRRCRRCERLPDPALDSVRAVCSFDGVVRTAIHQLKFRHARSLAPFLARLLAIGLERRPLAADLVIPVPLSPSRQRERGFNQSALIASGLAGLTTLPPPGMRLLTRARDTRPQVGLSAIERHGNLRGAFHCPDPSVVAGRRCLVIDDVMTTGATLEACAEPLAAAGAARVIALVVAREQ